MSITIYEDIKTSDIVVQSSCTDIECFMTCFAEALSASFSTEAVSVVRYEQIIKNAMPIAFKLAGYSAPTVREQRTLVCGNVSPDHCRIIANGG